MIIKNMKKEIIFLIVLTMALASCNTGKRSGKSDNSNSEDELEMSQEFISEHSSRNSVDWAGFYKGMIPCADCEGIEVDIQLNEDNTYKRVMNYLGKGENKFTDDGPFEWDDTGGKIRFKTNGEDVGNWYRVGENQLLMLDADGNSIDSHFPPEIFVLEKIDQDYVLLNKYWRLIELNSKEITANKESENKEPFISLKKGDNRVVGNTGCNNLMGSFKVNSDYGNEGEISFSQLVTTRMACLDVTYEHDFIKALEDCDNYSILNNTLSLKDGNELLAKFIGVYMQ